MKYYSEITQKLYDTMRQLQEAEQEIKMRELKEKEARENKEKETAIEEIYEIMKQSADLDRQAAKKMQAFDMKYGIGAASNLLIQKVLNKKKDKETDEKAIPNSSKSSAFEDILRDFLSK